MINVTNIKNPTINVNIKVTHVNKQYFSKKIYNNDIKYRA